MAAQLEMLSCGLIGDKDSSDMNVSEASVNSNDNSSTGPLSHGTFVHKQAFMYSNTNSRMIYSIS